MERKKIDISIVHPNEGQIEGLPANPRLIKDEKFKKLVKSIQDLPEMTEARDLLVYPHSGEYIVIGGNMRLRAYQELGWKEVPCCILPEGMPVEKLREMVIQDNNPFGETDWNMIANEWNIEELKDWGVDLPADWDTSEADGQKEAEEDDFSDEDAEKAEPRVKQGEIWQLGEHRLMCEDCTYKEMLNKLTNGGGEMIDLYLTDPPYNVGYGMEDSAMMSKRKHRTDGLVVLNDKQKDSDFFTFLVKAYQGAESVMKKGASFYIFHADNEGYNFRGALRETDSLELKQTLIWRKDSLCLGRQDYQWIHEPCLYGWKKGASHHWYSDRKQVTVIDFNRPKKSEEHPTMKPVGLFAYLIQNSTNEGDSVLDTFGGSGTTLIACEQLNRKCYMMELDPHYCDVIIARWEKLTGKEAVKVYG